MSITLMSIHLTNLFPMMISLSKALKPSPLIIETAGKYTVTVDRYALIYQTGFYRESTLLVSCS